MTPTTPLASTLTLCDQINLSFQAYQSLKGKVLPLVLLFMLASIASVCVHLTSYEFTSI